jgi:SSS family transporter
MSGVLANLREYWLVHTLLGVYTVLLAWHAWRGNRATKGLADYYVGGRAMGGVVIGLSFFATYSSTNSFVGFAGQAYTWGTPWLLLTPFLVFFSLFAWRFVAPRLRAFTESLDSLTVPDFIGFRFDSTAARVCAALIVLFASFFYMTAVFKGIGNLLEAFLAIPYPIAIGIVFAIVMAYTVVGGFISVVKTDAVQGVVMIVGAVLLFAGTVDAAGGVGSFFAVRETPAGADLFRWGGGVAVPVLFGVLFSGTVKMAVEPRQLSRFYALANPAAARTGLWVSTLAIAGVYALLTPIGIYARRIFPEGITQTDTVVPQLLASGVVFSPGTSAFLLVAMVAAAMSSLDSVLLVMASTCDRDIVGIRRRSRSERSAMQATRMYVVLFAAITALISLNPPGSIVTLTAFSGSLYAACFFPALLLGLHWRRGDGAAVLASFAGGLFVLFTWRFVPGSAFVHEVFPALAVSLAAYVGVALARRKEPSAAVARLFDAHAEAARAGAGGRALEQDEPQPAGRGT